MTSSGDIEAAESLIRSLVTNAARAGAEATTFMLAELRALARTAEAMAAVQEADAAWLVFSQALAGAMRSVRDSQETARDS
jgi:hypothetical protein